MISPRTVVLIGLVVLLLTCVLVVGLRNTSLQEGNGYVVLLLFALFLAPIGTVAGWRKGHA